MALKDIINQDLQTIEADLGNQTFIWKGEEYVCIPGSHGTVATLEDGGFSVDADLIINVRKDQFSDMFPASQQKVTFADKGYRIATVRSDATDAFLRLYLVDDTRGI